MLGFCVVFFLLGLLFGEIACSFIACGGVNSLQPLISCAACGKRLRPSECIPVLSYRIIKGKSICCGRKIPKIYPAFEFISGAAWLICALVLGLSPFFPTALSLVSVALIAAASDINAGKIHTMPSVFLLITGVIWNISLYSGDSGLFIENLLGLFIAGLIFFVAGKIKKGLTDYGDIGLMAAAGLVLGARLILLAVALAAVAYLCFQALTKKQHETDVPLGPFLALGILLSTLVVMPLL